MFDRFLVIVLDGFGVGAMKDAPSTDKNANTLGSLLKYKANLKLPTLEKIGLMNAYGAESNNMKFVQNAIFGRSNLMHHGADTFFGHQEIMGTKPKKPHMGLFSEDIVAVEENLMKKGYKVERLKYRDVNSRSSNENADLEVLLVEGSVVVADNIEAQKGLAYNVTASLDYMDFSRLMKIGQAVREVVKVSRVITFGGSDVPKDNIIQNIICKEGGVIGVDTPKCGVYTKNYQVVHMGYGVDFSVQLPTKLHEKGLESILLGKVADIVYNPSNDYTFGVDTKELMAKTLEKFLGLKKGFLCLNVQETDLSGHQEDAERYVKVLGEADNGIASIMAKMNERDILVVMADHGNDPLIGHSQHTREQIPLMVYSPIYKGRYVNVGVRDSLSDIASSVVDNFKLNPVANGKSFLTDLE